MNSTIQPDAGAEGHDLPPVGLPTIPIHNNHTISVHITNLEGRDAAFLSGVISFFTDPRNNLLLEEIKSGRMAIHYCKRSGAAALIQTFGNN